MANSTNEEEKSERIGMLNWPVAEYVSDSNTLFLWPQIIFRNIKDSKYRKAIPKLFRANLHRRSEFFIKFENRMFDV